MKKIIIITILLVHLIYISFAQEKSFSETLNPTGNPIGGGLYYSEIFTTGDIIVHNAHELLYALIPENADKVIYIDADSIDLSLYNRLTIPKGATLCSNRGKNKNTPGVLLYSNSLYDMYQYIPLFITGGDSIRITGIRMKGASGDIWTDYTLGVANAVRCEHSYLEIDNCELYNWNKWAIDLVRSNHSYIHHNYIHHTRLAGFGYGIWVGGSVYIGSHIYIGGGSTIEANNFHFLRHAVAGGSNTSSYYLRYNVFGNTSAETIERHAKAQRGGFDSWIRSNLFMAAGGLHYGLAYPADSGSTIITDNYFNSDSPAGYVDKPVSVDTNYKQVFIEHNHYGKSNRVLPTAVLKCSDTMGIAPYKVIFDGSDSYDSTGYNIIRYVFNWGDGTETIKRYGGRVPHNFKQVGEYVVSLTVYNKLGIPSYPITKRIYIKHEYKKYMCSMWIKDSYPGDDSAKYFKQILIDGRPVWESDAAGDNGWEHAVVNLTPYIDIINPVHTLQVRILARVQSTRIKEMHMWVDGVSVSNSSLYNGDFEINALYPPWNLTYYRVNGSGEISAGTYADDFINGEGNFKFRFMLGRIYYSGAYGELNYKKLIFK